MIKYRYAIGSDRQPVDIKGLTEATRRTNAPYFCYGCGKELIAVLPKKDIVKHFSHKSAGNCSRETYLHELGKSVFLSEYTDCLKYNKAFIFSIHLPATCDYYANTFGGSCDISILHEHDLTNEFKVIEVEKQVGDFRPDILLSSDDGLEKIFIEIAVTHEIEQPKINSGHRIIELKIDNEQDVTPIKNHRLNESDDRITTYNLNKKHRTGNICNGDCHRQVNVFMVYESGKCILVQISPKAAISHFIRGKVKYKETLGFANEETQQQDRIFIDKVREIHFNRFYLKNCYLCRYHGIDGFVNSIFCKTYKKSCSSNEAVECDRFKAFRNLVECHKADKDNEEYMRII